jgi:Ca2+-binding RTX toxin-like protein
MSAVFLTTMGTLYSGSGINVNAVTVGDDGWIYLAGIDYSASMSPSYKHSLTVLAYKDGQLSWKQDFHDRAYGSFEALTFKNGAVYAAGAISTEFNVSDLSASDGSTVSAPEKKAIDPKLKALYDPKNPWFFQDPTYPIYVKLNGETGQVELAKVLPSPNVQGDDRLRSISVDSQDNVYVGGGGWNPGPNPNDSFTDADFYWFIRKFSTTGNQLWEQSAEVVSVDPLTDKLYLTRYQDQMVQLDPATGNDNQVFSSGLTYHPKDVSHWVRGWTYDAVGNLYVLAGRQFWDSKISDFSDQHGVLVKVDTTSGTVAWTTPFGMSADSCMPNSITFAPDGNLLVGGHVVGSLEGNASYGGSDGFLMEFNPTTGSIVSTEVIGTSSYESISQVKYQAVLDKSTGVVIDYNMIIGGSFGARRYSLEGHDEKDIYLITDQGFQLIGNALDNHIQGGGGDDSISAGIGNDELVGGLGKDTLDGGVGYDIASYESSQASVVVDLKKGTASGVNIGSDSIKNIEKIITGSGGDTLVASDTGSHLDGGLGNDKLTGGAKADTLVGGEGNDSINAAAGNDEIAGEAGNDTIDGGAGFDSANFSFLDTTITVNLKTGMSTNNEIGNDTIRNIEKVNSGSGNDILTASDSGSQLEGGGGNDLLTGGTKTDTLVGGDGNDIVDAGAGDDLIIGGDGAGDDTYKGGDGIDTVKYTSALSGIRVDLSTSTGIATSIEANDASHIGNDQLLGIENIIAGNYADILLGSNSANNLAGEDGNDEIIGHAGNDTLIGGNGNDTLNGGIGSDSMTGGLGDDVYVVDNASDKVIENANQGIDTIQTTISIYTLNANFENLIFVGSAAFKGTGNTVANVMTGGSGNDTLTGGTGIDTFNVTAGTDSITDFGTGGAEILTVSSAAIANVIVAASWTATSATSNSGTANLSTKGFAVNLSSITTGSGFSVTNTGAAAQITGSAFADTLTGAAGNDMLNGGLSNDRLMGGKGVDNLTGGSGSDTFLFSKGDTGQAAGKFDIITDFTKGTTETGDLIDYSNALVIGGGATSATSTEASINQSIGIASFATGSGTTISDALNDIASNFTKATDTAGEFAFFKINNSGNYFLFISDGVKGVGANDIVVQLTGISDISSIDLAGGNLTLLG